MDTELWIFLLSAASPDILVSEETNEIFLLIFEKEFDATRETCYKNKGFFVMCMKLKKIIQKQCINDLLQKLLNFS